jgi:AraC-type DNA-binding domain-containing proteins
MVNVQPYPIDPILTPYIRMIWTLDLSFTGEPFDLRMTADCYPHLVIRCENAVKGLWQPEEGLVPVACLKGISTHSRMYKMSVNYSHIAVSFYPNGIKNIFGIDAHETVNHLIEAEYLFPDAVIERIILAPSHHDRAALLNSALIHMLRQRNPRPDKRTADFLFNHKEAYYKKLGEYNISERQFERLFYRDVGLSPSFYKRLYTFEETLATIRNGAVNSLTELAYGFGYADQAHFCREFKMFTGESASAFIRKDRIHEDNGAVQRPDGIGHLIGASL